jgi:hypothetical protein
LTPGDEVVERKEISMSGLFIVSIVTTFDFCVAVFEVDLVWEGDVVHDDDLIFGFFFVLVRFENLDFFAL